MFTYKYLKLLQTLSMLSVIWEHTTPLLTILSEIQFYTVCYLTETGMIYILFTSFTYVNATDHCVQQSLV